MLLVFAWSSVGLILKEVYTPIMKTTFEMNDRAWDTLPKFTPPRLQASAVVRAGARRLMPPDAA